MVAGAEMQVAVGGTPDFGMISDWGQELQEAMRAAGWGDERGEVLIWKTGYSTVPMNPEGINTDLGIDFSGYSGAGFSLTPDDMSWQEDPILWAESYRSQIDRTLVHFASMLPEDGGTWPAVTEFGAWAAPCGFWNAENAEHCESFWSEDHIVEAYAQVLDAVRVYNESNDQDYRAVFPMDAPWDSNQFALHYSERVQEAIREGLANLD